ncbi:LytR/AlgR family response regulator transcription factor [Aquimarina litoralis]|uniref:LytR/AlgR family response regulator transcription factor n=1 Tax=Aquimarina litoralis TaxID=584605 RepID=UPI001C59790D|nr:LytTR family DNA-binding domain-containing protein [Aquimarina litoralis]MBW1298335.1 hypothetical protein [Aquimarina litoralis]
MIFSLQNQIQKTFPLVFRDIFYISLISSVLVFLLLVLFQPFEYRTYSLPKVFGDSLLTAFLVLVITFSNRSLVTYLSSIKLNLDKNQFITHSITILLEILAFIAFSFLINLFFGGFDTQNYLEWLVSTVKYILIFEILLIPLSLFVEQHLTFSNFFYQREDKLFSSLLLGKKEKKHTYKVVLSSSLDKERFELFPKEIIMIKSSSNYVEIFYFNEGKVFRKLLRNTLEDVSNKLSGYSFLFRCHRSYLLNMNNIKSVEGNKRGYKTTVFGLSETIPVSRSKIALFNEIYTAKD